MRGHRRLQRRAPAPRARRRCAAIAAAWRWRGHAGAAPADRRFPQGLLPALPAGPTAHPNLAAIPPEGALRRTRSRRHLARCPGRRRRRLAAAMRTAPERRRPRPARIDAVGDLLTPARHAAETPAFVRQRARAASPPGTLALDDQRERDAARRGWTQCIGIASATVWSGEGESPHRRLRYARIPAA